MICQWRYVYAVMAFLGLVMVYMLRVNINVAIVAMANISTNHKPNQSAECSTYSGNMSQTITEGEYNWSSDQQTMILASFYWGYTLMQIPCGILALYYSAKWIYGMSTLLPSLLTFLVPLAASYGPYHLVTLRFLIGLVEGPTFPTQYTLSGRWVLGTESALILTFISSGSTIGTIVGQTMTGAISQYLGWRWVFYIMGSMGIVWFVLFSILVHNRPIDHPFIGAKEQQMLIDTIAHNQPDYEPNKVSVPWLKVFTSRPYLAFLLNSAAYNFTWYTMINCLPLYIGIVLGFDISKNGGISSLPYIALLLCSLLSAFCQDWLRSKKVISLTKIRKLFCCFGMVVSAIFLYCVIYTGCNVTLTIALLCLSVAILGLPVSTMCVNLMDMAPSMAGALLAVVNVVNALFGIITPYVKEYFTRNGETRENWSNVFITGSALSIIGAAIYLLFGSGSIQPWAYSYETEQEVIEDDENDESSMKQVMIKSNTNIQ